ncbi:MAG: hypothetical protein JWL95_2962 [Gemmatimonadetes bacterium]|nr:hypothetical protein [Gemmatimonadota bacterium]
MTDFNNARPPRPRSRGTAIRVCSVIATLAAVSACNTDKLLKVADVDVVSPAVLVGRSVLPSALAAAIGDFGVALGGSSTSEGQSQMVGLLTDELINAESFPTRIEVDQRNTNPINATMLVIFRDIARARATADAVADRYKEFDPTNRSYAEVLALAAYTRVILAENYCSGVPISTSNADGSFTYGEPQTTAQILTLAIAKFDEAIAVATAAGAAGAPQLALARIGKGRAQLDLGQFAAAAVTVAAVPTSARYVIFHDENSTRQNNGIFTFAQTGRRFAIPDREGINGMPFRSLNDPRAPAFRASATAIGFDASTPLIVTPKFPNRSASTPVAEGVEARLIEAEAALQVGNSALYLSKLNEARAGAITYNTTLGGPVAASPPPIAAAPATQAGQVDLLFQERAIDLFLTSHRVGDLRRLIRQYGRDAETVFPTGSYFKGGSYGKDVNLPVPFEEQNNPQFKGCLNRNA